MINMLREYARAALVSLLRAQHVKKRQEMNYRIISNILHVIITTVKI